MEDLSRKISELLGDPRTMEQIKGLAGMLTAPAPPQETAALPSPPAQTQEGGYDASLLQTVMKLTPLLGSLRDEDDSTRLLRALKPFLHEERAARIDGAVRLLHIMKLLPLLKSAGLDWPV